VVEKEREVSRERHRELTRQRWGALGAAVTVMVWSGNILGSSQWLGCWCCPREEEREKKERGGWLGREEGNEIGPSEGELGCAMEKKAGGQRDETMGREKVLAEFQRNSFVF
jgi:hypothetical protein